MYCTSEEKKWNYVPLDRKSGSTSGWEERNYLWIRRVEVCLDRKTGATYGQEKWNMCCTSE
jgi:hypothetical protein